MERLTGAQRGFLLLSSRLGVETRRPLTMAQLRTLAQRVRMAPRKSGAEELTCADLLAMGYSPEVAERILALLREEELLDYYLEKAARAGCAPITRADERYPLTVRQKLGLDAPGCLWAKGDLSLLKTPAVALVGSRELRAPNEEFARRVGQEAARQGYTLISGNARGADKTAQRACLAAGGRVISIVADSLEDHRSRERMLFLSEDSFDLPFSAQRALSRNRVIHSMSAKTFVAQATLHMGGTWDGTEKNLRSNWSSVFCFDDASPAARELAQLGACMVTAQDLQSLDNLRPDAQSMFDN